MKQKKFTNKKSFSKKINPKNKIPKGGATEGKDFWQKEYQEGEHFSLSHEPSNELRVFMKWLKKLVGGNILEGERVLDVGCGNGRNIGYLAKEFGAKGVGFDIADSAIEEASKKYGNLGIEFKTGDIGKGLPVPDQDFILVIDLMVSHFLKKEGRELYLKELLRVVKPGGFICIKTFVREGDLHVSRLLKNFPSDEEGAYIHPKIGAYEYVWREKDFRDFFGSHFKIHVLHKSHGYQRWGGQPYKRRYMVAYLELVAS